MKIELREGGGGGLPAKIRAYAPFPGKISNRIRNFNFKSADLVSF
jgi:hypothetical protein